MKLAKVLGTVVSTHKEPTLQGSKFVLVQLIDQTGQLLPEYEVAADCVGAGIDEWVLVSCGSAARQPDGQSHRPIDALAIAIVDTVNTANGSVYSKKDAGR
jgi:carbon dioxide concentrating mechanism protein CcmL